MTCSLCTELLESFQWALDVWLDTNSELSKRDKNYRWRVYRAHASVCGGWK